MKSRTLFFAAILTCLRLFAQEEPDSSLIREAREGQRSILKTNPLPLLCGNVPLQGDSGLPALLTSEYRVVYEIPVADHQSVMAGISYLGKNIPVALIADIIDTGKAVRVLKDLAVRGFRFQGMYRFYLSDGHLAPRGMYIGPQFS